MLVAQHLGERLGALLGAEVEYHSYTLPSEREELPQVEAGDVLVWATPVYAGRIPNKTLDYVRRSLHADGNPAVALVTFGNRAYDNALAELVGLMEDGGMRPFGAAAMVTRHAFSDTLGAGRPNEEDLAALDRFAAQVAEILLSTLNYICSWRGASRKILYPPEDQQCPCGIPQGQARARVAASA